MYCKIKVGYSFFGKLHLWLCTYKCKSEEQAAKKIKQLYGMKDHEQLPQIIPSWVYTNDNPLTFIVDHWLAPVTDDREFGFGFQKDYKKALVKKVFRFIVPDYKPEKNEV